MRCKLYRRIQKWSFYLMEDSLIREIIWFHLFLRLPGIPLCYLNKHARPPSQFAFFEWITLSGAKRARWPPPQFAKRARWPTRFQKERADSWLRCLLLSNCKTKRFSGTTFRFKKERLIVNTFYLTNLVRMDTSRHPTLLSIKTRGSLLSSTAIDGGRHNLHLNDQTEFLYTCIEYTI